MDALLVRFMDYHDAGPAGFLFAGMLSTVSGYGRGQGTLRHSGGVVAVTQAAPVYLLV
jgi:hypothetical protein